MRELYGFDTNIAKLYGINAAIIAQFLKVNANSEKGIESCDDLQGRRWHRCSQRYLTAVFPFLTRAMVARALKTLYDNRVIYKQCMNENKFDHTLWYAFTPYGLRLMEGDFIDERAS